jgi:hypothetical protein
MHSNSNEHDASLNPLPVDPSAGRQGAATGRVLIVSGSIEKLDGLSRALATNELRCTTVQSAKPAVELVLSSASGRASQYELVVLHTERCSPAAMKFVREMSDLDVATVLVCPQVSFDEAVQAMRAGASDIVSGTVRGKDLQRRVCSALAQHRGAMSRQFVHDDCIPLLEDVDPQAARVSGFRTPARPDHLIAGSVPKARRIKDAPAVPADDDTDGIARFETMIRSELDVESLLRHSLEFLLAQAGPTNAAVFLPAASGDFSLGAYVNLSCPKDTVEVLLDHLANVAAPRLESSVGVLRMNTDDLVEQHVGAGTQWLSGHDAIAFCCRDEGECLAVFLLFRERHAPFAPNLDRLCASLSACFGAQLARVVRIHHRHLPKDKWGKLGEPVDDADDQGGMAA